MRRRIVLGLVGAAVAALLVAGGFLAYMNRERPAFNMAGGLALSGYDPVSYFPEGGGTPRPGDSRFTAVHEGREYRFLSEGNRVRFEAAPDRYEPQFGGWCAYAVANGYKFEIDPESHLLVDGRLLLFYRGILGDARAEFEKEGVEAGLARADGNWPSLAGAR